MLDAYQDPSTHLEASDIVGTKTILQIHKESMVHIFGYVDSQSVAACRQVCKKWQNIIDGAPWNKLAKRKF